MYSGLYWYCLAGEVCAGKLFDISPNILRGHPSVRFSCGKDRPVREKMNGTSEQRCGAARFWLKLELMAENNNNYYNLYLFYAAKHAI